MFEYLYTVKEPMKEAKANIVEEQLKELQLEDERKLEEEQRKL
jgi:hypothetical protein